MLINRLFISTLNIVRYYPGQVIDAQYIDNVHKVTINQEAVSCKYT